MAKLPLIILLAITSCCSQGEASGDELDLNLQTSVVPAKQEDMTTKLIPAEDNRELKDNKIVNKSEKNPSEVLEVLQVISTIQDRKSSEAATKKILEQTENKGSLILEQYGWYVAQWAINWYEVTIDDHGKEHAERKGWPRNWDDILSPFSTTIVLGANCKNISVYVREYTGWFGKWITVIDKQNVPLIDKREVKIGGTTLSPWSEVTPDW